MNLRLYIQQLHAQKAYITQHSSKLWYVWAPYRVEAVKAWVPTHFCDGAAA